jgi:hypothetical protein
MLFSPSRDLEMEPTLKMRQRFRASGFRFVAFVFVLAACHTARAQAPSVPHLVSFLANVAIRSDGTRVTVTLDTIVDARTYRASSPRQPAARRVFVLQTYEPLVTPLVADMERALVVFEPHLLRVTTDVHRYDFAVVAADDCAPSHDPTITSVVGFGLAHLQFAPGADGFSEWSDDPDPSCSSGGEGATACSATDSSSTRCAVACAPPYAFACCDAASWWAACRCVEAARMARDDG